MRPRVGLLVWTDNKTQQSPWSGKRGTVLTHNSPDDVMFDKTRSPQVLKCYLGREGGNEGHHEADLPTLRQCTQNAHTAAPKLGIQFKSVSILEILNRY